MKNTTVKRLLACFISSAMMLTSSPVMTLAESAPPEVIMEEELLSDDELLLDEPVEENEDRLAEEQETPEEDTTLEEELIEDENLEEVIWNEMDAVDEPEIMDVSTMSTSAGIEDKSGDTIQLTATGGETSEMSLTEGSYDPIVSWGSYEFTITATGYNSDDLTYEWYCKPYDANEANDYCKMEQEESAKLVVAGSSIQVYNEYICLVKDPSTGATGRFQYTLTARSNTQVNYSFTYDDAGVLTVELYPYDPTGYTDASKYEAWQWNWLDSYGNLKTFDRSGVDGNPTIEYLNDTNTLAKITNPETIYGFQIRWMTPYLTNLPIEILSPSHSFKVIYDANGGVFNDGTLTRTMHYQKSDDSNTPTTLAYNDTPFQNVSYQDHLLLGWSTSEDATTADAIDVPIDWQLSNQLRLNLQNDITLFAVWTDSIQIHTDANGGSFKLSTAKVDWNLLPGSVISNKALSDVVRDGYKFGGWGFSPDEVLARTSVIVQKSCTLYAIWIPEYPLQITAIDSNNNLLKYGGYIELEENQSFEICVDGQEASANRSYQWFKRIGEDGEYQKLENASTNRIRIEEPTLREDYICHVVDIVNGQSGTFMCSVGLRAPLACDATVTPDEDGTLYVDMRITDPSLRTQASEYTYWWTWTDEKGWKYTFLKADGYTYVHTRDFEFLNEEQTKIRIANAQDIVNLEVTVNSPYMYSSRFSIHNPMADKPCTHIWSTWTTTRASTYTEKGTKTRTCSECGEVESAEIPMLQNDQQSTQALVEQEASQTADPVNTTSVASVEAAIVNATDDKDPVSSVFGLLQARTGKITKSSIKITWKKVPGAVKYRVYGNKCGQKYVKLAEVTGTAFVQKKLKKGTYYKYLVVAVSVSDEAVTTSKTIYASTKGGKYGNYKKVTASKKKVSVKRKKTLSLKAKAVGTKVKRHRKLAYESSNPAIATVSRTGKIRGLKKGTCYIYAYAQNGVYAKVKVTVK